MERNDAHSELLDTLLAGPRRKFKPKPGNQGFFKAIMDSSLQEYMHCHRLAPNSTVASNLAVCQALACEEDQVELTLAEVREKVSSPNWEYRRKVETEMRAAIAYLVLGDHDKAIETLEAASQMEGPIFLNRELDLWFIFDRLRGNPRFDALLKD